MKMAMVGGLLCIVAESAQDGFEIGQMVTEAWLQDKYLTPVTTPDGGVALTLWIPGVEDSKKLGGGKDDS